MQEHSTQVKTLQEEILQLKLQRGSDPHRIQKLQQLLDRLLGETGTPQ